jgi:hypothetical protein
MYCELLMSITKAEMVSRNSYCGHLGNDTMYPGGYVPVEGHAAAVCRAATSA